MGFLSPLRRISRILKRIAISISCKSMIKHQVLLWAPQADQGYFRHLLEVCAPHLLDLPGIGRLQFNLADEAVAEAADKRMSGYDGLFDAMCSFTAGDERGISEALTILSSGADRIAVYRVEEEEPLPNTAHPTAPGERTPGFSQLALLHCPSFQAYDEWLGYWKHTHTAVALATQSSFRYVQNRVLSGLNSGGGAYHAIVEECFPAAAMTSTEVFYNAPGQPELCQQNMQKMMESCTRFIDFSEIEVLPTSEYCFY